MSVSEWPESGWEEPTLLHVLPGHTSHRCQWVYSCWPQRTVSKSIADYLSAGDLCTARLKSEQARPNISGLHTDLVSSDGVLIPPIVRNVTIYGPYVCLYVCLAISHTCTPLRPLDRKRCHLAGTLIFASCGKTVTNSKMVTLDSL